MPQDGEISVSYLNHKPWAKISREERFFCARLFDYLKRKDGPERFIKHLKAGQDEWGVTNGDSKERYLWQKKGVKIQEDGPWDVGYEVAFFRDILFDKEVEFTDQDLLEIYSEVPPQSKRSYGSWKKALSKRTYDFCLFSEHTIIVIEAKMHGGFAGQNNGQLGNLDEDKKILKAALRRLTKNKKKIDVLIFGLISSVYNPSKDTRGKFDAIFTWRFLNSKYKDSMFNAADKKYKGYKE